MANFVAIVDPDEERRVGFVKTVQPLLPPVDGLVTANCAAGDFAAVWAAGPRAPVSAVTDGQSCAVVWGDAMPAGDPHPLDAKGLSRYWAGVPAAIPGALDGFHAAILYRPGVGVVLGADLLGMFPVNYAMCGRVLLMGSSPELFRHHPEFTVAVNPRGLVGILLTMHQVDGEGLLRGVRRLAPGHLLVYDRNWRPQELKVYELPVSTRHFGLPFSAHVELLDAALDQAMRRHAPQGVAYGLSLSGGRDSRVLAGLLKRHEYDVEAVTFGMRRDFEVQCATRVARVLGFKHHAAEVPVDNYSGCGAVSLRWEHLAGGFNHIPLWGSVEVLRGLPRRVVTGYAMDPVVGGSHITWAYSASSQTMSFEAFFHQANAYGIRPAQLKGLLRREVFGDLVMETIARIRETYEGYGEQDFQRALCFDLCHRQRFNTGGIVWLHSFGAWPVLPFLDQEVLALIMGLPASTLAERRAEDELLCSKFPELAALPLDRNSADTTPLRPRLRWRLGHALMRMARPAGQAFPHVLSPRRERRRFFRLWDFNGCGWLGLRQEAEPCRRLAVEFFEPRALDALLPGPGVSVKFKDGIIDASGAKSLLGFLLWLREYH